MNSFRPLSFSLALVACGFLATGQAHAQRTVTSEVKTLHEWANLTGTGGNPNPTLPPWDTVQPIAIETFFPIGFGNIDLSAALRGGTTTGRIKVSVSGYAAGDYTVSAVTASSSSTVVLGTLTVTSGSISVSSGHDKIPFLSTAAQGGGEPIIAPEPIIPPIVFSSGKVILGGTANPFPSGFSPFDVATISLSDSTGTVVSTGTLTPVANGYLSAVSPLSGASGFAVLRADSVPRFLPIAQPEISSGVVSIPIIIDPLPPIFFDPKTGSIAIHAKGLPASDPVTCYADGTEYTTATTGSDGSLNVFAAQGAKRKIPSSIDLFSVRSVTVEDGSGNVLVSGSF